MAKATTKKIKKATTSKASSVGKGNVKETNLVRRVTQKATNPKMLHSLLVTLLTSTLKLSKVKKNVFSYTKA
jgi:hypothetical protein